MAKSNNWQKTAIAATAALLTLTGTGAMALSLGRITVQSSLGEPLRAEIDVPDINAEEAASLRASVALPEAFTSAGLEYNAALSGLQTSLLRRGDGRAYIKLSSERPINDPFVDLILEANWSSGRIVRDYTLLFDPPSLRKPAPVSPSLPQVAVASPTQATPPPATTPTPPPQVASSPKPRPAVVATPVKPSTPVPGPIAKAAPAVNVGSEKKVLVRPGDTATRIAMEAKESSVSLDQMLVAMLKSNPQAFDNNNIDRLRSGAVIDVPTTDQALSLPAPEASRVLRAQSKDFAGFKRALASNAPVSSVAAANRATSGKIESNVVETKPKAQAPDKLTLSKGAVQAGSNAAQISQERAEQEAAARAAELARNIEDLKKASAAVAAATAPPATTPVSPAASAPAAAVVASTDAPRPQLPASAPAPITAPPAVQEVGLLDELLENPIVPVAGAALVALLGGLGFYRIRQRKRHAAQVDSSFLDSRLQPDSFFGGTGGQRVDTNSDAPLSGSSMVYSASQLDAADDVDPVAEADVYMAYGRDLQAEEILKEAIKTNPGRLAIYTKLLEIFAKRRDARSFEATAVQARKITGNESPDWARICELGLSFDPDNPFYQPGGVPTRSAAAGVSVPGALSSDFGSSTVPQTVQPSLVSGNTVDLDLDLDFSIDDDSAQVGGSDTSSSLMAALSADIPFTPDATARMNAPPPEDDNTLDFHISGPAPLEMEPRNVAQEHAPLPLSLDDLSLDLPSAQQTLPEPTSDLSTEGMLEFDMDSLSMDLESAVAAPTVAPDMPEEDPLETKLALAEEFVSIGDEDGARALIEEVVAEATGDMRAKAQRALSQLN